MTTTLETKAQAYDEESRVLHIVAQIMGECGAKAYTKHLTNRIKKALGDGFSARIVGDCASSYIKVYDQRVFPVTSYDMYLHTYGDCYKYKTQHEAHDANIVDILNRATTLSVSASHLRDDARIYADILASARNLESAISKLAEEMREKYGRTEDGITSARKGISYDVRDQLKEDGVHEIVTAILAYSGMEYVRVR